MRINNEEIECTIEMFVNSIYDEGELSGWINATEEQWIEAVIGELFTWKTVDGCSYHSNENRFEGKEKLEKRVKKLLQERLQELYENQEIDTVARNK